MVWTTLQTYGQSAKNYAQNNPKKAVAGIIAVDGVTNGFGMTTDMGDALLLNDGLMNGSAIQGAGEFAEVVEETNDVAFNWADMGVEAADAIISVGGHFDTGDGNFFALIPDAADVVTETVTDGEEYAWNLVGDDGLTSSPEYYEQLPETVRNTWDGIQNALSGGADSGAETAKQEYTTTEAPETPTETATEPGPGTPTETQAEPTPTETVSETVTETATEAANYSPEVFDQNDQQVFQEFFNDVGKVDSLKVNLQTSGDGSGEYVLNATDVGGESYHLDLGDGTYDGMKYNIDGEEIQEVVQAKEEGKLKELFGVNSR